MPQTVKKKPNKGSNLIRWISFTILLMLGCALLGSLMLPQGGLVEEVPLSSVIARRLGR